MPETTKCKNCGAAVRMDAPFGHCSKCLLELGFGPFPEEARSPAAAPQDQARSFGDYDIIERIGRGGMGVVFKARQRRPNRLVALKMVLAGELASPTLIQRFRIEAEAAANLDHPNIVPIYEVGESAQRHYFTMKLIEGISLAQLISKFGFHDGKELSTGPPGRNVQKSIATLMVKVARAVHYAHQRGVLHRDIKPSNILVDVQGEPHLTDFGVAKMVAHTSELTLSGAVIGTPSYMAPEQAAGDTKHLTTAADIYSLGAVLYELLTGRPPFRGETPVETLRKVVEQEPERPQSLNKIADPDLATICLKCLEKDPRQRYGSAEALAEDLERWLRDEPILAHRASRAVRFKRWARRNPLLTATSAGLVMLMGAALILMVLMFAERRRTEELSAEWRRTEEMRLDWREKKALEMDDMAANPGKYPSVKIDSRERHFMTGTLAPKVIPGQKPIRLLFGVYPHLKPTEMVEMFAPTLDYLERSLAQRLSKPVLIDFVVFNSYAAGELALEKGQVDLMRVGPGSFVLARRNNPGIQLLVAQRHNDFGAVIFVSTNSGVLAIAELRGRPIVFGDSNSTATILAKAFLLESGLSKKDFSSVTHRAGHSLVVDAVKSNPNHPAGVAKETAVGKDMRALHRYPIVGMPWVARSDLDPEIAKALKQILLTLQDESILDKFKDGVTGFKEESLEAYQPIEPAIEKAILFGAM